ncbi:MAG: ShlB/FhaC/HecB family hemolysin secretion/activation protein [Martelella sp.]|uniref:ShlB/FhaC/HecB family hemolysin secretion/activation protein n=1 Tax=Martelella sp. TaxID=1969699 RepID=UPI003241EC71
MRQRGTLFLSAVLAGIAGTDIPASAQSFPGTDGAARAVERENRAFGESQDERRMRQSDRAPASGQPETTPAQASPAPGGPCFQIRSIILQGFEAFSEKPEGYDRLVGTCATAADIAGSLNTINEYYRAEGYITTRAYVPEQDVADGSLEITIVPGRLEGYVYADGRQADNRIRAAFPGSRGDLLSLRELEQGLDNINGPRSARATFELIPGEEAGGSFVQVKLEETKPWYLEFGINNDGYDSTGEAEVGISFGYDNLFGLNDQLNIEASSTLLEDRSQKYADSFAVSWSVPYRNWLFSIDGGASPYFFVVPGINESYPLEGESYYVSADAERLLARGQSFRLYGYGGLKLTRTRTFIDNYEIETQRRHLTIGSLGLRGDVRYVEDRMDWELGMVFGVDALDAYVFDKSIVDPNFALIEGEFNYRHEFGDSGVAYIGQLVGQYSSDVLPGIEQFSIGSWSTVRGFHDDSMYGDSGFYLRNTLEWNAYENDSFSVALNAGLDAGYVAPSTLRQWSQNYLVGASLGADFAFGDHVTARLAVGQALSRPDTNPPNAEPAFEAARTVFYADMNVRF